jgi:hypothetical protein
MLHMRGFPLATSIDPGKVAWLYTDDRGNTYRRNAAVGITTQLHDAAVVVGGADGSAEFDEMPKNLKPRRAIVAYLGHEREVVCYSADAYLYVTEGATINLNTGTGSQTFTSIGWEGEQCRHSATRQTT